MLALRKYIEHYTKLSEEDWQIINKAFERKVIDKNQTFVEKGKVCKYFYFLEEGLVRFYTLIDGNDITKMFTIAPGCFTSKSSIRKQKPAQESIETLEKSVIWQVRFDNLERLSRVNSWNEFIRKFIYEVDEFAEEFLMEVKTKTAEERYLKLTRKYPTVIQKIPLMHLSTFLGIAPQSLSRIRKKLHENRKS